MSVLLLKPAEMAKALKVSESTLAQWRSSGLGPAFIKLGPGKCAPVRYLPLEAYPEVQL